MKKGGYSLPGIASALLHIKKFHQVLLTPQTVDCGLSTINSPLSPHSSLLSTALAVSLPPSLLP